MINNNKSDIERLFQASKNFIDTVRSTNEYQKKKEELLAMYNPHMNERDREKYERNSICFDIDDLSYSIGWNVEGGYGQSIAYACVDEKGKPYISEKKFYWEKE